MKRGFQVPLKSCELTSSQTSNENLLASSQIAHQQTTIYSNSQLSTPGLSVNQLKLPAFARQRQGAQGTKTYSRRGHVDNNTLTFSQQCAFLQPKINNPLAIHDDSVNVGFDKKKNNKQKSRPSSRSLITKSRQKINTIKSTNVVMHNEFTRASNAEAKCTTPKRSKYIISKKKHSYSFPKTPERRPKRFNGGSHSTPEETPAVAESSANRYAHLECRTPAVRSRLETKTPPSKRKLFSIQRYFLEVETDKSKSESSVHEESSNDAMLVSKTLNDSFPRRNTSVTSGMVYEFPLSPSSGTSTRKVHNKIVKKKVCIDGRLFIYLKKKNSQMQM